MNNVHKTILALLIVFSVFHTVRDVSQYLSVTNSTTSIFEMERNWCGSYCDLITVPFEIFIFAGSVLVLKRDKFSVLGRVVLVVFGVWILMFSYDFFVFNDW